MVSGLIERQKSTHSSETCSVNTLRLLSLQYTQFLQQNPIKWAKSLSKRTWCLSWHNRMKMSRGSVRSVPPLRPHSVSVLRSLAAGATSQGSVRPGDLHVECVGKMLLNYFLKAEHFFTYWRCQGCSPSLYRWPYLINMSRSTTWTHNNLIVSSTNLNYYLVCLFLSFSLLFFFVKHLAPAFDGSIKRCIAKLYYSSYLY